MTPPMIPPLPWRAQVCPALSTPHLAHAGHPGQYALVVAFPGNLAEEKVDLVVVRVVGVRDGVSCDELGL